MDISERIKQIARHYVPEWTVDQDNPDLGWAFAKAFAFMLEQSEDMYQRLWDKHYIEFLNYMEIQPPPPQSGEGYIQFELASGAPRGEGVPRETVFRNINTDTPYTLEDGVYVTPALLAEAYLSSGDRIFKLEQKDNLLEMNTSAVNLQTHEWVIQHPWAFENILSGKIKLILGGALDKGILDSLEWEYMDGDNGVPLKAAYTPDGVTLSSAGVPLKGGNSLRGKLNVLPANQKNVKVKGIKIQVSSEEKVPIMLFHQETQLPGDEGFPFGKKLYPNDTLYCACSEAFSKKGGKVVILFDLTMKNLAPLGELPDILKNSAYIAIEEAVLQYWNGMDFVSLRDYTYEEVPEKGAKEASGEEVEIPEEKSIRYSLSFTCPEDIAILELFGEESYWIRLKITELSNVYMSVFFRVPYVEGFHVTYDTGELYPSRVTTVNNMKQTDYPGDTTNIEVFVGNTSTAPALFLGYDRPFGGNPVSFLIQPEIGADTKSLDFYALTEGGWGHIPVTDGTEKLRHTGVVTFNSIPRQTAENLFGQELYWIRWDLDSGFSPKVLRFKMNPNTAPIVQKTPWQYEIFTPEISGDGSVRLELKAKNITDFRLFLDRDEFLGYSIDSYNGMVVLKGDDLITAGKGAVKSVRVEYRSSLGAEGNCEENSITRMSSSAGFVKSVTNPLPVRGGWSFNPESPSYSARKLRHNQRAVTKRDFEELTRECAGSILKCKCLDGKYIDSKSTDELNRENVKKGACLKESGYITLVYLPEDYPRSTGDTRLQPLGLSEKIKKYLLERCSPIFAAEGRLSVCEAHYASVSVNVTVSVEHDADIIREKMETEEALNDFLDPVAGNFNGSGYDFGESPGEELIQRFLYSLPNIVDFEELTINISSCTDNKLTIYIPGQHNITVNRLS